jgi:uncharacterized protein (TIGR03086 family)
MGSLELLSAADSRLLSLVAKLGPDDLGRPSPCAGWNVRSMLSHAISSIDAFSAAVDGRGGPSEADLFSGADILGVAPLDVARESVERSHEAWASLTGWDASVTTVLGAMSAAQAVAIITYSTLIHSWDLAVAIGEPVEFTAAEADLAGAVGSQIVPAMRPKGLFSAEVQVPAGATPTQRLVAFAGRNPL